MLQWQVLAVIKTRSHASAPLPPTNANPLLSGPFRKRTKSARTTNFLHSASFTLSRKDSRRSFCSPRTPSAPMSRARPKSQCKGATNDGVLRLYHRFSTIVRPCLRSFLNLLAHRYPRGWLRTSEASQRCHNRFAISYQMLHSVLRQEHDDSHCAP